MFFKYSLCAVSFYTTNFHSYEMGSAMSVFEILSGAHWTSVIHCSHSAAAAPSAKCQVALSGLGGANGVAVSTNTQTVYVAEHFAQRLVVCERAIDYTLKVRQKIELQTGNVFCVCRVEV
jgi:sugar lactone lactonase YvrE